MDVDTSEAIDSLRADIRDVESSLRTDIRGVESSLRRHSAPRGGAGPGPGGPPTGAGTGGTHDQAWARRRPVCATLAGAHTRRELSRNEMSEMRAEFKRHTDVLFESLRDDIRMIVEGLMSLDRKVDSLRRPTDLH